MIERTLRNRLVIGLALAQAIIIAVVAEASADRLRVELDKAILLRLEQDADVVFVANPSVADVTVESPRMLFVLGLAPGETSLRILDADGKDVVATTIVVVPTEERTVTVNRNTPGGSAELTYSCDPRCAQVRTPTGVSVDAASFGGAPAAPADQAAAGASEDLGALALPPVEQ
jgi:hypothetical protein